MWTWGEIPSQTEGKAMKFSTKNGLSAKGLVPSTDARTPLEKLLDLHDELCSKGREIMQAKNADYTCGSADPYANFRIQVVKLDTRTRQLKVGQNLRKQSSHFAVIKSETVFVFDRKLSGSG